MKACFEVACAALAAVALVPGMQADSIAANHRGLQIQPAAPPKAQAFSLHDVRLLDGPFKAGQDIAVKYLLSLEPDRLLANQPGRFFDVTYPIPEPLTRGKDKVTVRFQAHPENWAGGLFGCRVIRKE